MSRYKPEKVEKRRRLLNACSHGDCGNHEIWDYRACWIHLTEDERNALRDRLNNSLRSKTSLAKAVLTGADLRGFDFRGANLSEAFLDRCNLAEAQLAEADLRRTYLGWANLEGADLSRAEIHGAVFTHAKLSGAKLLGYSLLGNRSPVNLTADNFRAKGLLGRCRIDEDGPKPAAATYRRLKAYFVGEGDYDSASWAAYCERVMGRKALWQDRRYIAWISSLTFGLIAGYGERPMRVLLTSATFIIAMAVAYSTFGLLLTQSGEVANFVDCVFFSAMTFATTSLPHLTPSVSTFSRLIVGIEAFLGIFSFGLFVFTLTKRYVAR